MSGRVLGLVLAADPVMRAALPSVRTYHRLIAAALGATLVLAAVSFGASGDVAYTTGVLAQLPTLLLAVLLASLLARMLERLLEAQVWRAFSVGLCFIVPAVVVLGLSWMFPVVGLLAVYALSLPAATISLAWGFGLRLLRRRGRRLATVPFFDTSAIVAVAVGYVAFFFVVPVASSEALRGALALGLCVVAAVLVVFGVLVAWSAGNRAATGVDLLAIAALVAGATVTFGQAVAMLMNGSTLADAIVPWPYGLAWAVVWSITTLIPYAEQSEPVEDVRIAQAVPALGVDHRFWPYVVTVLLPPLLVAAVVVDDPAQTLAAFVGFLLVLEVICLRQVALMFDQSALRERQRYLQQSARVEAARTNALLDLALALARSDVVLPMCRFTASQVSAAVPSASAVIVLAAGDDDDDEVSGAALGCAMPAEPTAAWRALAAAAGSQRVLRAGEGVLGLSDVPPGSVVRPVQVTTAVGELIGIVALVAPPGWEPAAADMSLLVGIGDELALALDRARLTARRRSSGMRLRQLVEHIPEAVADLAPDLTVHACNGAFADLIGKPIDEVIGSRVPVERLDAGPREEMRLALRRRRAEGEATVTAPDGGRRTVAYTLVPRHGVRQAGDTSRRRLEHILVVLKDLTERRSQENRILGLARELAAKERVREALLDRVITSAEQERHRLARAIAAGPIHGLTSVAIGLDAAGAVAVHPDGQFPGARLRDVRGQVADLVSELREFVAELRPPVLDERGVGPAVAALVRRFAGEHRLRLESDVRPVAGLSSASETLLYRVAQECLAYIGDVEGVGALVLFIDEDTTNVTLDLMFDRSTGSIAAGGDPARLLDAGELGLATVGERLMLAGGSFEMSATAVAGRSGTSIRAVLPRAGRLTVAGTNGQDVQ